MGKFAGNIFNLVQMGLQGIYRYKFVQNSSEISFTCIFSDRLLKLIWYQGAYVFRKDQPCLRTMIIFVLWKAILNKCSYDLMLLRIEQSMTVATNTEKDIEEFKEKLKADTEFEVYESLKKLERELKI